MEPILGTINQIYHTFLLMAPYLMLGLVISGILHVVMRRDLILRHLGGDSVISVFKAALIGVPLPLCSCGVLPVALSLRKGKASKASTISFLISTPQTGIDSIIATWGLLGLPFAILRCFAAFAMGILGGIAAIFVSRFDSKENEHAEETGFSCALCFDKNPHSHTWIRKIKGMISYAFGDFLDDISTHLAIGIVISGLIGYFVPETLFTNYLKNEILSMFAMILGGIPLYICATASIPIALTLMAKGASVGAAFVFLTVGPATNAASITLIAHALGKKLLVVYLSTIIILSISFGLAINAVFDILGYPTTVAHHIHQHEDTSIFKLSIAALFFILMAVSLLRTKTPRLWGWLKRIFNHKKNSAENTETVYIFGVMGMSCTSCARKIKSAMLSLPGVTTVDVDIKSNQVKVTGRCTVESASKAIENAGYKVYFMPSQQRTDVMPAALPSRETQP